MSQLSMAYSVCRGVTRSQARNFYWAFLALPRTKRNALYAVYAFMRHADDLSDAPGFSADQRRERLLHWAEALHRAVAGERTDDPVILALADTQARFKIPLDLFDRLVYGTAMDLQFDEVQVGVPLAPYQTFEELFQYCYHVASVVGLVCIHIFGYRDPRAEELAVRTGIAFQLTNIIRDVKEDAAMGRIYLPREDLERFGRTSAELAAGRTQNGTQTAAFRPLLEFEASRARAYYAAADELIPLVDEDSAGCLWALVEIYRRLLQRIAERQYDVFSEKISLSVMEKMGILGKGILKVVF